jgi:FtsP/CotA-like multicopper oxidase with cupredoxin domain
MSAYHIALGQLEGDLIAVDGIPVRPVPGRNFPITVAQRLDIELAIPKIAAAYPVLAMLEGERGQTGIVLLPGKGQVTRVSGMAEAASPPLTLGLERSLRAAEPLADRKADRTHVLNLTGSMQGYRWSFNNVPWSKDVPPLTVAEGERVEIAVTNQTMMPHPVHLHGLSLPKSRFERIDDVARQGLDAQQRLRTARSGVCRACPSQAKHAFAPRYNSPYDCWA